jgi:hypothetical protein
VKSRRNEKLVMVLLVGVVVGKCRVLSCCLLLERKKRKRKRKKGEEKRREEGREQSGTLQKTSGRRT